MSMVMPCSWANARASRCLDPMRMGESTEWTGSFDDVLEIGFIDELALTM